MLTSALKSLFFLIVVIISPLVICGQKPCGVRVAIPTPDTGDEIYVDPVLVKLQALQNAERISDDELKRILRPLFHRPAFFLENPYPEAENYGYWLYAFVITRTILCSSVKHLKTRNTRDALENIAKLLRQNEDELARLYGDNFTIQEHVKTYGLKQKPFTSRLPDRTGDKTLTKEVFENTKNRIVSIRVHLRNVNLVDFVWNNVMPQ